VTFRRSTLTLGAVAIGVLPLIACGSDRTGVTTAPSSVLSSALSSTAAIEQSVVSGSRFTTAATVQTVTSLVSGTACPTLQFMISTYVIRTSAATQYDGGSCTTLKAGTKIFMEGTSDAPQTFNATRISFSTDTTTTPTPAPTPVQTEGTVTATTGVCPDLVFNIGSYVFKITSATLYSGATCAGVKTGVSVYVAGTKREGDSFVVVTGLGIKTSTTPTVPTTPVTSVVAAQVDVSSLVSTTSCPALSFMVGGYTVVTSASTQFVYGTCANLKAGSKLVLTGSKSGDTIVASIIAFRDVSTTTPTVPTTPAEPVSGESTVTSLVTGASCPALSFMMGSYTISVTATTMYERGACADIAAGAKLGVTGTKRADGSVLASKIQFRGNTAPPVQNVEGEGVISNLRTGTSCPALEFYIGTYLIKLDASTLFDRGACSDLAIGKRVHVKGGQTADGPVLATQISVQSDSPGTPVVEGDGKVSSLVSGTACPALKFVIEEYTVTLGASTTFIGGSCADVAAGKKLGVKGIVTGEKQVLATQIVFKTGN
jgi:hypothetical protein